MYLDKTRKMYFNQKLYSRLKTALNPTLKLYLKPLLKQPY